MNARKLYKLIFFGVLLLLLLKPLCLGGIGLYAKFYLRSKLGWSMQYRSVEWKKKGIYFSDVLLIDSQGSSIAVNKAAVSFAKQRIAIDRAHLVIAQPRWNQQAEAGAWTFLIRKGTFVGEGIAPGTFTFERRSTQELGKLSVLWGASHFDVHAHFEPDGMVLDGQFQKIEPSILKRLFGDLWGGIFSGAFSLKSDKQGWIAKELYIEAQNVSHQGIFERASGKMSWRGALDVRGKFWSKGSFQGGRFYTSNCLIEESGGSWSFDGTSGGKWDFSGLFQQLPISIEGRQFSSMLQPAWSESSIRYGACEVAISGCEQPFEKDASSGVEDSLWQWRIEGFRVPAQLVKLAQDITSLWIPEFASGYIESGFVDGAVVATQTGGRISSWALEHLQLHSVKLSSPLGNTSIEHLAIKDNLLAFEGIDMEVMSDFGSPIHLQKWSGKGLFDERKWTAAGMLGQLQTTVHLAGSASAFLARAELEGPLCGNILFSGGWNESALTLVFQRSTLEDFAFEARARIDSSLNFTFFSPQFSGSLQPLTKLFQIDTPFVGQITASEEGFRMTRSGSAIDWCLQAQLSKGSYPLWDATGLEKISGWLLADPNGISLFDVRGVACFGKEIPFFCPIFQTDGCFDFRLTGPTRDWARLAGNCSQAHWAFDREKSHFLGNPFEEAEGSESSAHVGLKLPIGPLMQYANLPEAKGSVRVQLSYTPEKGAEFSFCSSDFSLCQKAMPFEGSIHKIGSLWSLSSCTFGPCALKGLFSWDGKQLLLTEGEIDCKTDAQVALQGKLDLQGKGECRIAHFVADLEALTPLAAQFGWALDPIGGTLEGEGYVRWDEILESDFDFTAHRLKFGSFLFENQAPIQLHYDSAQGVSVRGLDAELIQSSGKISPIRGKIGLLQYDSPRELWTLTHGHFHLPADVQNILNDENALQANFISKIVREFFAADQGVEPSLHQEPDSPGYFGIDHPIDLVADIEMNREFSSVSVFVKEGFIPWQKQLAHVQNLRIERRAKLVEASCDLLHDARNIQLALQMDAAEESQVEGRFSIGESGRDLIFDWIYDGQLRVQTIEGQFGGIDASFHFEGESLIGSAHLDMATVSEIIPQRIATVFSDLKMGKGYELMGRLYLDKGAVRFRGILSGKALELFGYQLRTLLAQVEFDPNRLRISDIKISDSAGIMKIDEIVAEGVGDLPWTLSIPRLVISELRPSLLQKVGATLGEMSPLVVRQLQIEHLKGLLEESKTWTATGHFHFINSYKREKTIFDIPSDVLSRIVGIDLDLLIPVRGSARFSLKDGYFRLFDLKDAYSENLRSEFFLIEGPDSPTVDLDGNIKIVIKMKQFVLFKLTEAFLISIEGKLNNPKFHLEKKRRLAELLGL